MSTTALVRPRVRKILIALLACLAVALLSATVPAAAQARGTVKATCADRLCKEYKPGIPSCWSRHGRSATAKCFIRRAARHFGQPLSLAYAIAYRESRFHWAITNPSSGTAGMYQFARVTWNSTPYRRYSPYHPRWAALAAMWMWKHGGYYHWRV